ncbi:hypothetical protein AMECASPLE_026017 [Ameca splendens]|uniref:Uncharacterized protein n=1 Tax=Ameca splendens TaxID=208324 RepID=A0ABV0XHW0_9TELE
MRIRSNKMKQIPAPDIRKILEHSRTPAGSSWVSTGSGFGFSTVFNTSFSLNNEIPDNHTQMGFWSRRRQRRGLSQELSRPPGGSSGGLRPPLKSKDPFPASVTSNQTRAATYMVEEYMCVLYLKNHDFISPFRF